MPTAEILINLGLWFVAGTVPAVARHAREAQGKTMVICNSILSGSVGVIAGGLMFSIEDQTFQLIPLLFALAIGVIGEPAWGHVLSRILGNGRGGGK